MEFVFALLGAFALGAILYTERQTTSLRHDVARLDRKLNLLLKQMGVKPPKLPGYTLDKDPRLPWEDEIREAIERLRTALRGTNRRTRKAKVR